MDVSSATDTLDRVRNNFEFAYVTQFLHFFHPLVGLDSFLAADLEDLLVFEPDVLTGRMTRFFQRLLKALPGSRHSQCDNVVAAIQKEYRRRGRPFSSPEVSCLADLPVDTRIRLVYDLCSFLFESESNLQALLGGLDGGASWRLEPAGRDAQGRQYWVFSDGRLFREIRHQQDRSYHPQEWVLLCWNLAGWASFLSEGLSSNPADRRLKARLSTVHYPQVLPSLQELSRKRKRPFSESVGAFKRSLRLTERRRQAVPPHQDPKPPGREQRAELRRLRQQREQDRRALKDLVGGLSDDAEKLSPIRLVFKKSETAQGGYDSRLFLDDIEYGDEDGIDGADGDDGDYGDEDGIDGAEDDADGAEDDIDDADGAEDDIDDADGAEDDIDDADDADGAEDDINDTEYDTVKADLIDIEES